MCTPQEVSRADDHALIDLLRAGCDAVLAEIVERHGRALRAHARRLLGGSGHDPDDAVQDTLLRAWASLRRDTRHPALAPWLHTVLRNRSLDLLRSATGRAVAVEEPDLPPAADVVDEVLRREAMQDLAWRLALLPGRQREALLRHAWGGDTHAEIAAGLATTPDSAKALVHRARRNLRAADAASPPRPQGRRRAASTVT